MVYRAPASSLESCCFISDNEYLSGSDNGTVALWGMLKKKPVFIVKNAHCNKTDGITTNGILGKTSLDPLHLIAVAIES